jgi:hypothetical protein
MLSSPATPRLAPSGTPAATVQFELSLALLLRACVNGAMTAWLLTHRPDWSAIFDVAIAYAFIDGALGLLTALLLERRRSIGAPPVLVAMICCDAIVRIGVGVALRAWPGLTLFPITIVLLFGALGAWAAVAGAVAIVAWLIAHERRRRGMGHSPVHALFDPLAVAGIMALAVAAYAFIVGPPADAEHLRTGVATVTGTLMIVFLAALVLETRAVLRRRATPGS